jgi:hypothetical protein
MSIFSFTTDYAGETSDYSGDLSSNTRTYRLNKTAITTASVAREQILTHIECPKKWDPWGPDDLGALCIRLSVTQDPENELIWRIAAEYTNDFGDEDPTQQHEDPLQRPTRWRYSSIRQTFTFHKDLNDKPFENAAAQPFRSPPAIVYSTSRYTITRPEATFSGTDAEEYSNTVNSAEWRGRAVGTVLLESITAEEKWEGTPGEVKRYFLVTYTIHVNKRGWQPIEVANRGTFYYVGGIAAGKSPTPAPDGREVWLDDTGDRVPNGSNLRFYRNFDVYEEKDLTVFQL